MNFSPTLSRWYEVHTPQGMKRAPPMLPRHRGRSSPACRCGAQAARAHTHHITHPGQSLGRHVPFCIAGLVGNALSPFVGITCLGNVVGGGRGEMMYDEETFRISLRSIRPPRSIPKPNPLAPHAQPAISPCRSRLRPSLRLRPLGPQGMRACASGPRQRLLPPPPPPHEPTTAARSRRATENVMRGWLPSEPN